MTSPSTHDPFASAPSLVPPPPSFNPDLENDLETEIDASLDQDADISMSTSGPPHDNDNNPSSLSFDGAADNPPPLDPSLDLDPPPDPRIPARKDMSLRDFLSQMDDYAPIIPDAVTAHALVLAGLPPPNPSNPNDPTATPLHLSRLLALAAQKFVADIAADAYQYSRMRSGNTASLALGAVIPGGGGGAGGPAAGAPGVVGAAVGGTGASGGAGAGQAGKEKGGTGQHVLGVQRAGFGGGGQGGGQGRTVLTMEDLGMAVGEYGVNIRRGEFYR